MNKIKLADEEFLYYFNDEWDHNIQLGLEPIWLSTQAFKRRLTDRGISISWARLRDVMERLLNDNKLEKMRTSNGDCWKPVADNWKV